MTMINQCDLKQVIQVNDRAKSYMIMPLGGNGMIPNLPSVQTQSSTALQERRGIVTYTTTVNDTGERKQLFGYSARHIKSTVIKDPSPDACDQKKERIETDGWYIDFDAKTVCPLGSSPATAASQQGQSACTDEVRNTMTGQGKLGHPLQYTTTIYGEDGKTTTTLSMETVEFSAAPLDAALFEVPAGYSQASSLQEMATLPGNGLSSGPHGTAVPATGPVGPKQPGAVRIGVAEVVNRTGRPFAGTALRDQLTSFVLESKGDATSLVGKTPEELGPEV